MKTKSISQTVTFNATPEKIYHMLLDQKEHAAFTNSKVSIDPRVSGQFTVFDSYCHGYTIELIEDRKIVQAWHFAEDGWPKIISASAHSILKPLALKQNSNSFRQIFPNRMLPCLKVAGRSSTGTL